MTVTKGDEDTGHWCLKRRDSRAIDLSSNKDRTRVNFYVFVECCAHLTNIQNCWLLW